MKKTILGALALCLAWSMTGCASTTPSPTPVPATVAPTASPTASPTMQPTNTPQPATPQPTMQASAAPDSTAQAPAQGEITDGTYRAEMSEKITKEEQGWQGYLELTVAQGALTKADFDYIKDGKKKSETTKEEYPMEPPASEWIGQYEEKVIDAGLSGEKIDTITGATTSARDVNALYQAALEAAQAGNTQTVVVDEVPQDETAE